MSRAPRHVTAARGYEGSHVTVKGSEIGETTLSDRQEFCVVAGAVKC